jgi:hypothetical protein
MPSVTTAAAAYIGMRSGALKALNRTCKFACYMWEGSDGTRDQSYTRRDAARSRQGSVRMLCIMQMQCICICHMLNMSYVDMWEGYIQTAHRTE